MADAAHAAADAGAGADKAPASSAPAKQPEPAAPASAGAGAAGAQAAGVGAMALQKKTDVGASNDPMEHEADAAAQRVMRATEPPGSGAAEEPAAQRAMAAPSSGSSGPTPASEEREPTVRRAMAAPSSGSSEEREPTVRRAMDAPKEIVGPGPAAGPTAAGPPMPAAASSGGPGAAAAPAASGPAPGPTRPVPAPDKEKDKEKVRRQTPVAAAGGPVPASVESYLDNSRGLGRPLPEAALRFFESRFGGASFADVRVHDDAGAADAARVLGAVAFTRGRDIFFAAGMYDPVSEAGRTLIAHELAHVLQQSGRALPPPGRPVDPHAVTPDHPNVIRRANGNPPAPPQPPPVTAGSSAQTATRTTLNSPWQGTKGKISASQRVLQINSLGIPPVKVPPTNQGTKPLVLQKAARPDRQRDHWAAAVGPTTDQKVRTRLASLAPNGPGPSGRYFIRFGAAPTGSVGPGAQPQRVPRGQPTNRASGPRTGYFFGTLEEVVTRMRIPPWDRQRPDVREDFDVDHRLEWQLGGDDGPGNLWLLEAATNRSVGATINAAVLKAIGEVVTEGTERNAANPSNPPKPFSAAPGGTAPPAAADVRRQWEVQILSVIDGHSGPGVRRGADVPTWTDIQVKALPFTNIHVAPQSELEPSDPNNFVVFFDASGGRRVEVNPLAPNWEVPRSFKVHRIDKTSRKASVEFYKGNGRVTPGPPQDIDLARIPGLSDNVGFFQVGARTAGRNLTFNGLSPLEFQDVKFDPDVGLLGGAKIPSPTVPLLRDVEIGVRLNGADVQAYATIQGGSLKLPGPFQVTGGALELAVGTNGFSVTGDVNFEIRNLARGRIYGQGSLGANSGFAVGGELNFDTRMFTRARLGVGYDSERGWSVEGELAVGEGKISGIKSASARVTVTGESVTAQGTFESSLRGLERGQLTFNYSPQTGMEIAGTLGIGRLPGIEGGTIDARVRQRSDGQGYSLSGGVTARPSIPGVTGSVTGRFEDGAFLAEANLGYQRGMLNGRVNLGITNQAVTNGRPAGPPTPNLTAWGGGQVSIRITPWLQGTIGLQLDPQGRLTVMGRVALPNELTVFEEKRVDKNIFTIGIDIPIVGVSVLGQRIGIFATIQGGLDASAGFGPGKLRALSLEVTYSPDNEAATTITGRAELFVPAQAGLRLFVRGGLGAGIPVVSATAGLEVSGALGLEGAATASVNVNWSAGRGLVLDARGAVFVEPKFRFAITGYVDVHADLWIDTIDLYKKRWQLAAFEYGSNLRFGVEFPVHYEEGKPFQLSLDQVRFTYPNINTTELLRGLIARIA